MKTWFVSMILMCGLVTLQAQKPKVLASASIFQDIARQIGGDLIDAQTIVSVGGDPHTYEPTPADAERVFRADIILLNGLTFEGWINELVQHSGTKARSYILTEGITPIANEMHTNSVDPHAWMTASNGKIYAYNTYKALCSILPQDTSVLYANYTQYCRELDTLEAFIRQSIQSIPEEQRILITSHDAFQYYGRAYGLTLHSVLGTSTDADIQTSDMKRLTDIIVRAKIPAIFIESTINPKVLMQLAGDTQTNIGGKLYADSLGEPDSPTGTYIGMLRENTLTIVNGLKEPWEAGGRMSKRSVYAMLSLGTLLLFALFTLSILRK